MSHEILRRIREATIGRFAGIMLAIVMAAPVGAQEKPEELPAITVEAEAEAKKQTKAPATTAKSAEKAQKTDFTQLSPNYIKTLKKPICITVSAKLTNPKKKEANSFRPKTKRF